MDWQVQFGQNSEEWLLQKNRIGMIWVNTWLHRDLESRLEE